MSTGTIRATLDFDGAIPTCWKYQMTSDWAKANAENTICKEQNQIRKKNLQVLFQFILWVNV